jgi:hypothetical protein
MNKLDILNCLNLKDPYPYIKSLNLPVTNGPLWGGKADLFGEIILKSKPKLIIELGAFLGDSTITMAKCLRENNIDCCIITIDTWLGSQEHWLQDKCNMLNLYDHFEFGISSMYNKFVTNVLYENLENYIVPMPTTTDTAYDILNSLKFKADIIYMDADHRESIIYNDLNKYENLLNEKGIIFGHDIDWHGVKKAVDRYCFEKNKSYSKKLDSVENKFKFWEIL